MPGRGRRAARRSRRRRRRRRRRRIMLVGGLIGFGIYKMSKSDADRVQQHTGTPPEEMDDAELEQAMDELDIDKQKITADDQEEGGGSEAPTGSTPSGGSDLDQLQKLADLHEQGILTDEEFAAKKKQILDM